MRNQYLSRVHSSLDVDKLQYSSVAVVGTGGSSGLVQQLARCGVDHFVLIDFDRVDASNVGRQEHDATSIGQYKVDVLANRLEEIRPSIDVETVKSNICELDEPTVHDIVGTCDLLIFATDSFKAQAYGNHLALQLQKRVIFAGLYQGATAGEIIWWSPDSKPLLPCFRCLAAKRYTHNKSAEKEGRSIDVSADGATIVDITLLDSIVAYIALGLLTQGASNRFGRLIDQLRDRNFLQVQLDPTWNYSGVNPIQRRLNIADDNQFFFNWCVTVMRDPDGGDLHCKDCEELLGHEFKQIDGKPTRLIEGQPVSLNSEHRELS